MPDLSKRKAAAERARRRRRERENLPKPTCADCGGAIDTDDRAHDPHRCGPCLGEYNARIRRDAGFRPDGRAA